MGQQHALGVVPSLQVWKMQQDCRAALGTTGNLAVFTNPDAEKVVLNNPDTLPQFELTEMPAVDEETSALAAVLGGEEANTVSLTGKEARAQIMLKAMETASLLHIG